MARQQPYPSLEALQRLEASLKVHLCPHDAHTTADDGSLDHEDHYQEDHQDAVSPNAASPKSRSARIASRHSCDWRMKLMLWWPRVRKLVFVGGSVGGVVMLAMVSLWWRLSSGPIELDVATP